MSCDENCNVGWFTLKRAKTPFRVETVLKRASIVSILTTKTEAFDTMTSLTTRARANNGDVVL